MDTEEVQKFPLSRLIGETLVVNRIEDLLHEPYALDGCGGFASVDDLVFRLKFKSPDHGSRLFELSSVIQCDGLPTKTESNKPHAWRYLCCFALGSSTVRVGVGFNETTGRIDMTRGMLQFNPNKIGYDNRLRLLIARIQSASKRIELKRWDLAIDIPYVREDCRLLRGARGYEYINKGRGITEYLGTRNKPGRFKLYDKTREAGLGEDWTRLELTCDGGWGVEEIRDNLPTVFAWDDPGDSDTRAWVRALGISLAMNIANGDQVDMVFDILSRDARAKLKDYLCSPAVDVSDEELACVLERVGRWVEYVNGGTVVSK